MRWWHGIIGRMSVMVEKPAQNTVATVLANAARQLAETSAPRLDAELLLAHLLQKDRAWLAARPEHELPETVVQEFLQLVDQRNSGIPLAYLTGVREFWSLQLEVNTHTLVPRPETELLVEQALALAGLHDCIIDAGTGSGAIALALASELPAAKVIATDISAAALQVARANADRLNLNIHFVRANWLTGLAGADLIVSNPPYIAANDPHLQTDGVSAEPPLALVAGDDGMEAFRQIVPQAMSCLQPAGWLLFEHGYDQAESVAQLMRDAGFTDISTRRDLGDRARLTMGRKPDISPQRR